MIIDDWVYISRLLLVEIGLLLRRGPSLFESHDKSNRVICLVTP